MADADDKKPGGKHTLTDHLLGRDFVHEHDGDADHDHDHFDFDPNERLEDNPIWIQDHVTLTSVGIDIGSAGTQVIFSRINLRRYGEDLTSRYYVVSRETLYQSPVALTPYQSDERIDDGALAASSTRPTRRPASRRRRSTPASSSSPARRCGARTPRPSRGSWPSSAATSSPPPPAITWNRCWRPTARAPRGSRTTRTSASSTSTSAAAPPSSRVLEKGEVIATAAVHIGGRLQVVDESGRIVRLDPAGRYHARRPGFVWNRGDMVATQQLDQVAEKMADALVAALTVRPMPHAIEHLYLTDPIADLGRIDGVMFSGGVGEYVYGREQRDFGDMGRRLGQAIRRRLDSGALPWPLLPAGECIRATALGASEYSVQLSGNTSYHHQARRAAAAAQSASAAAVLRVRRGDRRRASSRSRSARTSPPSIWSRAKRTWRWRCAGRARRPMSASPPSPKASGMASPPRSSARSRSISCSTATSRRRLGAILREELLVESEILAIDGVVLRDFDYIDLGKIRMPSYTVPVTIKSLVFSEDPRSGRPHQRIHHHEHGHHHHDHGHARSPSPRP